MRSSGLLFAQFQQATQAHIVGTQRLQLAWEPLFHKHSLPVLAAAMQGHHVQDI
jgi:muramoyltetrapeptide carboxypeptidase LdcA involved in peptidoglycan recycling